MTSLDLTGRRILMASFLYYGLDESAVPDATFDGWCKEVAGRWDELDPYRQWTLGTRAEILASGYKVKVTLACASAAIAWWNDASGEELRCHPTREWTWSKKWQVGWLNPGQFARA